MTTWADSADVSSGMQTNARTLLTRATEPLIHLQYHHYHPCETPVLHHQLSILMRCYLFPPLAAVRTYSAFRSWSEFRSTGRTNVIPTAASSARLAPKRNAACELDRSQIAPKMSEAGSAPRPIARLYQP